MLHPHVSAAVDHYLRAADRLVPGRICGFYVVGSTALGAFRPGRSDIDFVAVVDGDSVDRLRLVQLTSNARTGVRAVARGQWTMPETVNGVFVAKDSLTTPVTALRPLASHVGPRFTRGAGFDVNPVTWKVLLEHGVAVRGPSPGELGLDPEPAVLREWNLRNLRGYWQRWALSGRLARPVRHATAWGVLGPPRLHHTIRTGGVVSKEGAGEYALEVFDARWHPLIREALAYWRGEPADPAFADRPTRTRQVSEFALEVIADAHR